MCDIDFDSGSILGTSVLVVLSKALSFWLPGFDSVLGWCVVTCSPMAFHIPAYCFIISFVSFSWNALPCFPLFSLCWIFPFMPHGSCFHVILVIASVSHLFFGFYFFL